MDTCEYEARLDEIRETAWDLRLNGYDEEEMAEWYGEAVEKLDRENKEGA
jgi:hypothetical protein